MTGIDADGATRAARSRQQGADTGRISEVGATYLVYEAYADSTGTDTFSYAVEDWTGQRSQAQIRVGVFTSGTDSGVYARDDEITLRPNTAATVPVAQNDISGDNTDLAVSENVESQDISNVTVADNTLAFTTPQQAGTYYVVYTVKDKAGLSDTATLTVNVDDNATIEPPTAYDYRVPSSATIDKKSIDVDVSQWIANPSGSADELQVAVDDSATDHAHVKGGDKSTTITVDLTDEARAVPYTVTNTTYNITSTAFIQVPAYGVFPPVLRPKAPALKVNAHETITINIADYVRVGAGKTAYVDGADSVSATKAADGDLYVNDQTLKFTAPKDYSGPASITFTAVDGKRDKNDKVKIINSAVLTLPITVIGRDVPAPTFSSPTIDVVAGESATTIDLTALTHSASDLYDDEKQYTYSGGADSDQVSAKVSSNGKLTVSADKTASPGTTVSVPISIQYSKGTVSAGVTVRVTASNRPLARINAKTVKVKAGSSEEVNLLSDAYNPFPDSALTVTGCTSDGASKLTVDCPSNGVVSISASSDIGASTNKVIVNVRDATNTKEREVTGTINVSVMDKPDAPLLSPIAGDPQDGAVNLSWTAGSSNGSPISEYKVSWEATVPARNRADP
ncbi:MAG: Ig-like domain-containing protein [Bifidobacterium sp.]